MLGLLGKKYLIDINGFLLAHLMILKILQCFIHYWNGFYWVQVIMSRTKHVEKVLTVPYQWLVSTSFNQTSRQVNYNPQENVTRNSEISCTVETPLYVGTSTYIHQKTRCRKLIDILSYLNISVDYDKLLNIDSQLADSVLTEINNNDGVYIPKSISKDLPILPFFILPSTTLI